MSSVIWFILYSLTLVVFCKLLCDYNLSKTGNANPHSDPCWMEENKLHQQWSHYPLNSGQIWNCFWMLVLATLGYIALN
jgi:hypothetical protein